MLSLLISVKLKRSISFESTLMVGRQNIFFSIEDLKKTFNYFNYDCSNIENILVGERPYADELFKKLGAKIVDSIDASDYEGASYIHDLNYPLKNDFIKKYKLVIDSGTLEHIFNVSQALKTMANFVDIDGHYIGILPANNFYGHGFYQFSSEFFYRFFTAQNSFEIKEVILFIDEPNPKFYKVPDTSEQHQRIQFTNSKPVYIFVVAKRINNNKIPNIYPQQMDYSDYKWKNKRVVKRNSRNSKKLKDYMPVYFKNLAKVILNRPLRDEHFSFNKPYFEDYKL